MPAQSAFVLIESGAKPYVGREVQGVQGGDWRTLNKTAELYERNGNATVSPGTVVAARKDTNESQWVFSHNNARGL